MTEGTDVRSVSAAVEVAIDPATAFRVFTEELEAWWLQGPINFFDSTRARAMRMEPGVGGRILEVYDQAGADDLEVARIVEWAPPSRLVWRSSLDDVTTTVTFTETPAGTTVRVEARLPLDGEDHGGTAWVRVVPTWLARWVDRRDVVAREPETLARLAVEVRYDRPVAAARWLRDVFGLEPASRIPDDEADEHVWVEFRAGDAAIIVLPRAERPGATGPGSTVPWVFVDDLDAHYERAVAGGATIEVDIWHHGARAYEASDLEGHRWSFAQASPRMRAASPRAQA